MKRKRSEGRKRKKVSSWWIGVEEDKVDEEKWEKERDLKLKRFNCISSNIFNS